MQSLASTVVTAREEAYSITFRLERRQGWMPIAVGVVMVVFCWAQGWAAGSVMWMGFGCVVAVGMLADWLRGDVTELVVTERLMVARGNVRRIFSSEIVIAMEDVVAVNYEPGGEDSSQGLYVRQRGWRNTCMLAGVTEEQADQIVYEIYRRFPEMGRRGGGSGSLLFGAAADLTSLDLSKGE